MNVEDLLLLISSHLPQLCHPPPTHPQDLYVSLAVSILIVEEFPDAVVGEVDDDDGDEDVDEGDDY